MQKDVSTYKGLWFKENIDLMGRSGELQHVTNTPKDWRTVAGYGMEISSNQNKILVKASSQCYPPTNIWVSMNVS